MKILSIYTMVHNSEYNKKKYLKKIIFRILTFLYMLKMFNIYYVICISGYT